MAFKVGSKYRHSISQKVDYSLVTPHLPVLKHSLESGIESRTESLAFFIIPTRESKKSGQLNKKISWPDFFV
jgi:hypothetical protein